MHNHTKVLVYLAQLWELIESSKVSHLDSKTCAAGGVRESRTRVHSTGFFVVFKIRIKYTYIC